MTDVGPLDAHDVVSDEALNRYVMMNYNEANPIVRMLVAEVRRLKRGEFTPEEFQGLCHHRDLRPGCTLIDFDLGCCDYQKKLFGVAVPRDPKALRELLESRRDRRVEAWHEELWKAGLEGRAPDPRKDPEPADRIWRSLFPGDGARDARAVVIFVLFCAVLAAIVFFAAR